MPAPIRLIKPDRSNSRVRGRRVQGVTGLHRTNPRMRGSRVASPSAMAAPWECPATTRGESPSASISSPTRRTSSSRPYERSGRAVDCPRLRRSGIQSVHAPASRSATGSHVRPCALRPWRHRTGAPRPRTRTRMRPSGISISWCSTLILRQGSRITGSSTKVQTTSPARKRAPTHREENPPVVLARTHHAPFLAGSETRR